MKYKIWDRINKRYDDNKWVDQGGKIIGFSYCPQFDLDDFEVQWVKEPGDDLVDPKIWEDHKLKASMKVMVEQLLETLSELRGIAANSQELLLRYYKDLAGETCK